MNITTIMLTAQSDLYSALTIITASQMKMHIIMLQYYNTLPISICIKYASYAVIPVINLYTNINLPS